MKILLLILAFSNIIFSQASKDYAVMLRVELDHPEMGVHLIWDKVNFATEYTVFKKLRSGTQFVPISPILDSNTLSFLDEDVKKGEYYEYQVRTKSVNNPRTFRGFGYIAVPYHYTSPGYLGKVLILVDSTVYQPLINEINRLEDDLISEGWGVIIQKAPRAEAFNGNLVKQVKNQILAANNAYKDIKSIFLLGRIPVPYSGGFITPPDGHSQGSGDHQGAWVADMYYGDINGTWLDLTTNVPNTTRPDNNNVPGDGKFDASSLDQSNNIEIPVGRVDFYRLKGFTLSEIELYKRYLDKNHNYRSNQKEIPQKALIDDDQFQASGLGYYEAFSTSGWRNFGLIVGNENIEQAEWKDAIFNKEYLLAYGCGPGSFTSAGGVINSAEVRDNRINAVFPLIFGSFFGNWDTDNNLMNTIIASDGLALTCGWAARPHWFMHHFAAGEPIGNSVLLSQNNFGGTAVAAGNKLFPNYTDYHALAVIAPKVGGLEQYDMGDGYSFNFGCRNIHTSLLGDPTLRVGYQYTVQAALSINAEKIGPNNVKVTWDGGLTNEIKYWYIYKSYNYSGPYVQLIDEPITTEEYIDNEMFADRAYYMVRRVGQKIDYSGESENLGQALIVGINKDGVLGIEDNESLISISPNPTSDLLNLKLNANNNTIYEIQLMDLTGNVIFSEIPELVNSGLITLTRDISQLSTGTYIISIKSKNGVFTQKLIKK